MDMHRSFWPRHRMSTPGTAAMSAVLLRHSAVATCYATVGLCALRKRPILGSPARSSALKSAPLNFSADIVPLLQLLKFVFVCRESPITLHGPGAFLQLCGSPYPMAVCGLSVFL